MWAQCGFKVPDKKLEQILKPSLSMLQSNKVGKLFIRLQNRGQELLLSSPALPWRVQDPRFDLSTPHPHGANTYTTKLGFKF